MATIKELPEEDKLFDPSPSVTYQAPKKSPTISNFVFHPALLLVIFLEILCMYFLAGNNKN